MPDMPAAFATGAARAIMKVSNHDIHAIRAHAGERNPSIQPMSLERRLVVAYT
jgi:hypothetical protein